MFAFQIRFGEGFRWTHGEQDMYQNKEVGMRKYVLAGLLVAFVLVLSPGCSTISGWFHHGGSVVAPEFPAGTVFFRQDVSGWAKTAILNATVSPSGKTIVLDSNKRNVWPAQTTAEGKGCNANAWIIFEYNGQWYAGTWE